MTQTRSTARLPAWSDEAVSRFWTHLAGLFGRKFYDEYGRHMPFEWRAKITTLSYERAKAVLEHYSASGDAYPPNCSQLMAIARQVKLQPQGAALLERPRSREVAAENIERLKHIVRSGRHKA